MAAVLLACDRQGWVTVLAAVLLALITLFTGNSHVDFLGAASFDRPQQAGLPCIAATLATAVAEAQLASNDRYKRAVKRDQAEAAADEERKRAANRAQRQAQCNLVQLRHQLEPNEPSVQLIRDVISLSEEYGEFA
jgi:hypothetical protein